MADLVPPRRGEPISDTNGIPTLRFLEYLEANARQTNSTNVDTEIDTSSINLSVGNLAALLRRIEELEAVIGIQTTVKTIESSILVDDFPIVSDLARIARLEKRIQSLEMSPNGETGKISELEKRVSDIEEIGNTPNSAFWSHVS